MACSARDVGVESIFTRGSASGDWQQRHHPSDLLYPAPPSPPAAVADEMGGGGGAMQGLTPFVQPPAQQAVVNPFDLF